MDALKPERTRCLYVGDAIIDEEGILGTNAPALASELKNRLIGFDDTVLTRNQNVLE